MTRNKKLSHKYNPSTYTLVVGWDALVVNSSPQYSVALATIRFY